MSIKLQWLATPLFQLVNSVVTPVALFQSEIQDDGTITLKIMEKNLEDINKEDGGCYFNPVCEVGGIEGGNGWVEKVEKFVNQYLHDKIPGFKKEWWVCVKLRKLGGDEGYVPISLF